MYFLRKMNPARSWNDPSIQHFQIACRETTNVHVVVIADTCLIELLLDNNRQIGLKSPAFALPWISSYLFPQPLKNRLLAAWAIVSLRAALPLPRLLLLLPDYVHTPRNTSAISL